MRTSHILFPSFTLVWSPTYYAAMSSNDKAHRCTQIYSISPLTSSILSQKQTSQQHTVFGQSLSTRFPLFFCEKKRLTIQTHQVTRLKKRIQPHLHAPYMPSAYGLVTDVTTQNVLLNLTTFAFIPAHNVGNRRTLRLSLGAQWPVRYCWEYYRFAVLLAFWYGLYNEDIGTCDLLTPLPAFLFPFGSGINKYLDFQWGRNTLEQHGLSFVVDIMDAPCSVLSHTRTSFLPIVTSS
jgi:hypothetical protein